jgi:hypothetical protein
LQAQTLNVPAAQSNVFPATVTGAVAGTTETVVTNPGITSSPATALIAALQNTTNLEQIPFNIVASGRCTVQALTTTLTVKLYSGTSTTVGSDTLLKTSGAITSTNLSFNWFLNADAIYDSVSGLLSGKITMLIDNQIVAQSAFANQPTGINNANNPVCSFVMSCTFSAANNANLFSVASFSVG